jgi:hypothetical protein
MKNIIFIALFLVSFSSHARKIVEVKCAGSARAAKSRTGEIVKASQKLNVKIEEELNSDYKSINVSAPSVAMDTGSAQNFAVACVTITKEVEDN